MVSLGIQVCEGLLTYYRNWKDHDDDFQETYMSLNDLGQTFQLLNNKLLALSGTPSVERAKACLVISRDNTEAFTNIRLLITSRREVDIEDLLKEWCKVQLALDEDSVNTDIDLFVKEYLATDKKLMRLPVSVKEEIEKTFHQKSDGMSVLDFRSD